MSRAPFWQPHRGFRRPANRGWVALTLIASVGLAPSAEGAPSAQPMRIDGELDLKKAVQLAANRNLSLLIDRLERDRIALGARAANRTFIPTLTLNADYETQTPFSTGLSNDQRLQYGASVSWKNSVGTSLSLSLDVDQRLKGATQQSQSQNTAQHRSALTIAATQPLLKGAWRTGAAKVLTDAALDIEIQRALFIEQLNKLIVKVQDAYWALAFAQADVDNKRRARVRAKKQYDDTKENIRRGIIADIEIYVVEENLVFFHQELVKSEQARDLARRKLARLLLVDPSSKLTASGLTDPSAPFPGRSKAIRDGLRQNPKLRAEMIRLKKNRVKVAFERNQALPALDVVASLSLNGLEANYGDHLAQVFRADRPDAKIGLLLTMPLSFSGDRAKVEQSKLEAKKQLLSLKRQEVNVRYEIGDVLTQIDHQRRQLKLAKRRIGLSRLKLSAEMQKYKNGISTLANIVRFQRELDQALISVRRAQLQLQNSRSKLLSLQGALHQSFGIAIKG